MYVPVDGYHINFPIMASAIGQLISYGLHYKKSFLKIEADIITYPKVHKVEMGNYIEVENFSYSGIYDVPPDYSIKVSQEADWCGHMLAYIQCSTGLPFYHIFRVVSLEEFYNKWYYLHEEFEPKALEKFIARLDKYNYNPVNDILSFNTSLEDKLLQCGFNKERLNNLRKDLKCVQQLTGREIILLKRILSLDYESILDTYPIKVEKEEDYI